LIFVVKYALDPRFKLKAFDSETSRREAIDAVLALLDLHLTSEMDTTSPDTTPACGPGSAGTGMSSVIPDSSSAHQELDAYIAEQEIPRTDGPLSWWADNQHRYLVLGDIQGFQ